MTCCEPRVLSSGETHRAVSPQYIRPLNHGAVPTTMGVAGFHVIALFSRRSGGVEHRGSSCDVHRGASIGYISTTVLKIVNNACIFEGGNIVVEQ